MCRAIAEVRDRMTGVHALRTICIVDEADSMPVVLQGRAEAQPQQGETSTESAEEPVQNSRSLEEAHSEACCPKGRDSLRDSLRVERLHVGAVSLSRGQAIRQEMADGGQEPQLQSVAYRGGPRRDCDYVVGRIAWEEALNIY